MKDKTEIAVMKALWSHAHPMTADAISQTASLEVEETNTALADMASRSLVALEDGNYSPNLTASEYCMAEIRGLVKQLYGGDAVAFLTDYIGTVGPEDRAALEDAINKGDRLR